MPEKKYFWLKLKDDFFEEKFIKALRRLPEGDKLVIVCLKMQLKSLKTEGILKYEKIMPTKEDELSLLLDEDINIVKLTLQALLKMDVVEEWDDETIYCKFVQDLIGRETDVARRVRKHRKKQKLLQCNDQVTAGNKCNTEKRREDKEKIRYKDIHIEKILNYWNEFNIIKHEMKTIKNRFKKKHENMIAMYGVDKILEAINNYATVLKDDKYYWSHIYTLWDFLGRKVESFFNEAKPLENFLSNKERSEIENDPYKDLYRDKDGNKIYSN